MVPQWGVIIKGSLESQQNNTDTNNDRLSGGTRLVTTVRWWTEMRSRSAKRTHTRRSAMISCCLNSATGGRPAPPSRKLLAHSQTAGQSVVQPPRSPVELQSYQEPLETRHAGPSPSRRLRLTIWPPRRLSSRVTGHSMGRVEIYGTGCYAPWGGRYILCSTKAPNAHCPCKSPAHKAQKESRRGARRSGKAQRHRRIEETPIRREQMRQLWLEVPCASRRRRRRNRGGMSHGTFGMLAVTSRLPARPQSAVFATGHRLHAATLM
jgi:hypothetical protein